MALSEKRSNEIFELTMRGGDSDHRKTLEFVTKCKDIEELQFFAENYNWDGDVEPIEGLIRNPEIDAGTLLFLFWYGCPEDYYLFYGDSADIEPGFERDIFNLLCSIEHRFVTEDYPTAKISFDPSSRISMRERHSEFVRPIPPVMMEPIGY